jgi:nickel transport system substrate-binding protein
MLKKMFVAVSSLALLLSAVGGCSKGGETGGAGTAGGASKVKELTMSEVQPFNSFSPLTLASEDYGAMYYGSNFYDTLVSYDEATGDILPGLAESWEVSDDGLVYTFRLRGGVVFHDGESFDAVAVKTNLDFIPGALGIFNGFFGMVTTMFDEVTVIDTHTVEVRLTQPYYGALNDFAMRLPLAMVSPKAYNEDGSVSDVLKTATYGTGPYMYKGETDGMTFTFVKNPDYWGPEPDVDVFHVKTIADNDARLLALRNGEVDILVSARQVSAEGMNELEAAGFGAVIAATVTDTVYIAFNPDKPPFNDLAVRKAVNHAVNKATICNSILSGSAAAADTLFPLGTAYCDQNVTPYGYDADKAIQLLEAASWVDSDGDGIREKNGVTLEVELQYATTALEMEDIALVMQDQLRAIGMILKLTPLERSASYELQARGNYQMTATYTYGGVWDPHTTIANAKPVGDSRGSMGVLNRAFTLIENADTLIDELNVAADSGRIQEIYDYLMTEVHEQALFLPLYQSKEIAVFNNELIADYTFTGTYNSLGLVDVASVKLK